MKSVIPIHMLNTTLRRLLWAAIMLTGCGDNAPADTAQTSAVIAACDVPPTGPGYTVAYGSDALGRPVAIVPAAQMAALMAYGSAVDAYFDCAFTVEVCQ